VAQSLDDQTKTAVLIGVLSVVGALSVTRAIALFTDVSTFAVNTITLLGLGMAIDYSSRWHWAAWPRYWWRCSGSALRCGHVPAPTASGRACGHILRAMRCASVRTADEQDGHA